MDNTTNKEHFHLGRKFAFAIYCAIIVVFCLIAFFLKMDNPNAGLLLSLIATPCLGIIGVVVGVEGVGDIKSRNNSQ